MTDFTLKQLEKNIYKALKVWHDYTDETAHLGYLRLYGLAQLEKSSVRQATNKVLLDALDKLTENHPQSAKILRQHFLDGMSIYSIASSLNVGESTAYRRQKESLGQLTNALHQMELDVRLKRKGQLEERLELPAYNHLIGIEDHLARLKALLISPEPPWLIAIEGLGGLGKTSLADAISRQVIDEALCQDFAWISARQHVFNPGGGIKPISLPALTAEDLVERLIGQLIPELSKQENLSFQAGLTALQGRLKHDFNLIIIDNLETAPDIETLLPVLHKLANPTKFILTSRQSLLYETGIYHFDLPELTPENTVKLVRHEAEERNLSHLLAVDDSDLENIYQVVGGNPLAIKLVLGQTHIHPLATVLEDLTKAQGTRAETFYTYIYKHAWDGLNEETRRVFLAMPFATDQGGNLEYLAAISDMTPAKVRDILEHLVALNLVNSLGDINQRRYTIHNLTRTFLQEQVAKWMT
ncbi:MAG: NB-ARC domain-containing protein [Chloroflexota bacterium]